ncbi:MAG: PAS domain S-box-containing protein [Alphaproteobacteria bacterium]|jgi:PAS domain S-box-containing protein
MVNEFENIKELSLDPVKREPFAPWAIFMLIAILPFLSMIAYLITSAITDNQELNVDRQFMDRIEIVSKAKADNIDLWLSESIMIAQRITHSRVIQMFSMDINDHDINFKSNDVKSPLGQQLIYIAEVLSTFVSQNDLVSAHLINRRSSEYVKSSNAPELSVNYAEFARHVFTSRTPQYSPLRMNGKNMLLDVYLPIFALKDMDKTSTDESDSQESSGKRVVGVLAITMSVKDKIQKIMQPSFSSLEGENIYLFQKVNGGIAMVRLDQENEGIFTQDKDYKALTEYKKVWDIYYLREQGKFDLSKIPKFGSQSNIIPRPGEILMVKYNSKILPLTIMSVLELGKAYKYLIIQRKQLQVIGQLVALMLFIMFLSFWWMHQEVRQRMLTEQYQNFADKVNAQRQLLLSINSAIVEHIGLKYFDGKYVYVNPPFAKFFKLNYTDVIGKNDASLYGEYVAQELKYMDQELLKGKKEIFEERSFVIHDKRHYFEISKAPFFDAHHKFVGIITVMRDVTEIVQERQLRERAMKNSMRSMMRIMERYDIHLVKHAKYLKNFVVDVAEKLNLSKEDKITLEICANLSQIGKIYVPIDILKSEVKLNDQDLLTYRTHIEDTAYILDTVDWGLPIVRNVYTMHEHLDGTGYPNKLESTDISKLSRILCVCDTFCNLVAPRRGHKIHTPEEAIKTMVNAKGKYDLAVIQVLAEVISEDERAILGS